MYNQKLIFSSKVFCLVFSILVVYSVKAEIKMKTEQSSTTAEINLTKEEEKHNEKQAMKLPQMVLATTLAVCFSAILRSY